MLSATWQDRSELAIVPDEEILPIIGPIGIKVTGAVCDIRHESVVIPSQEILSVIRAIKVGVTPKVSSTIGQVACSRDGEPIDQVIKIDNAVAREIE